METKSEDSIHKLRLKLLNAEPNTDTNSSSKNDLEFGRYVYKSQKSNLQSNNIINHNNIGNNSSINNNNNSISNLNGYQTGQISPVRQTSFSRVSTTNAKPYLNNNTNTNTNTMYVLQSQQSQIANPYAIPPSQNGFNQFTLKPQPPQQQQQPFLLHTEKSQSSKGELRPRMPQVLPPLSAENFYQNSNAAANADFRYINAGVNSFGNGNNNNNSIIYQQQHLQHLQQNGQLLYQAPPPPLPPSQPLMHQIPQTQAIQYQPTNYALFPPQNQMVNSYFPPPLPPDTQNYGIDPFPSRRMLTNKINSSIGRNSSFNNINQPSRLSAHTNNNFMPTYLNSSKDPDTKNYNAVLNEVIEGDNMDEIIDLMAKRRIALKRLENDMDKHQRRTSNLLREASLLSASNSSISRGPGGGGGVSNNNNVYRRFDQMPLTLSTSTNNLLGSTENLYPKSPQHKTPLPSIKKSTGNLFEPDLNKENGLYNSFTPVNDDRRLSIAEPNVQNAQPVTVVHHHHYYNVNPNVNSIPLEAGSQEQINGGGFKSPKPLLSAKLADNSLQYQVDSKLPPLKLPANLQMHRSLFWQAAVIVRFLMRIRIKGRRKAANRQYDTSNAAVFRIRLMEIMTGVHRIYLEPAGPIYSALMQSIRSPYDMSTLLHSENEDFVSSISMLCENVETIVEKITEFMPKEGILGTNKKSALLSLITEGNRFPDNYFWDTERELLEFDSAGNITNINQYRATLLLVGAFISRGLITTLLVKPVKFRLIRGEMSPIEKNNLKFIATVLCYITRKSVEHNGRLMRFPLEWQDSLYNDKKMAPIYENPNVDNTIRKCQQSLNIWLNEYVKRLHMANESYQ